MNEQHNELKKRIKAFPNEKLLQAFRKIEAYTSEAQTYIREEIIAR